jgi:hypothetical protein
MKTKNSKSSEDESFNVDTADIEACIASVNPESNEEEKKIYWKTMINLTDIGLIISVNHIHVVEKTFKLVTSNYNDTVTHWYGILINGGCIVSPNCPKTDIALWYRSEEFRDQRYSEIIAALDAARVKVIEMN